MAVRSKPTRRRTPAFRRRATRALGVPTGQRKVAPDATVASWRPGAPPPASQPVPPSPGPSGGDRLLLVFFGATVLMVVAVVLVGAVVQRWVLVPVMLVDFAVTLAVIATLLQLLGHDG